MTFRQKLRKMGACDEALEWVGKRGLKRAWKDCRRATWMWWLCTKLAGKSGWPTRKATRIIVRAATKAWCKVIDKDGRQAAGKAYCAVLRKRFKIGRMP